MMGFVNEDMQPEIAISDPKAMRALAHPVRLRLLGELRQRGPQNVRTLSSLVAEPPNSVSYHLRTLAKYGFVSAAPGRATDARESWWRALHRRTTWDPESVARQPELRTARAELERQVLNRWYEKLAAYLDREESLDPSWMSGAVRTDASLVLTAEQLAEMRDELRALMRRWEDRSAADREGASRVTVLLNVFKADE
jgi:DNA-binding transcriptional ArsR family regulator